MTRPAPCACWTSTYTLGHDHHCCFLVDDRAGVSGTVWRDDKDVCHGDEARALIGAGVAS